MFRTLLIVLVSLFSNLAVASSQTEVRGFVSNWFSLFDRNAPVELFLPNLDIHLRMEFPEATLVSQDDFISWYSEVLKTYQSATHDLKEVTVSSYGDDWKVSVKVLWQATAYSGEKAKFLAQQNWIVKDTETGLKISNYLVKEASETTVKAVPFKDSDLEKSCTCVGGPGHYQYACAPIVTTCYGGPGNYPYQCTMCR